jgi:uncharacterized protein (DUF427 family)
MTPQPHTVTTEPASAHIVVRVDGAIVADTTDALVLHETGIRDRYYIPDADVRRDLLSPTSTSSHCPYKGDASYWNVTVDGTVHPDVVWGYLTPLEVVAEIAGHVCFYDERDPSIDIQVEPATP